MSSSASAPIRTCPSASPSGRSSSSPSSSSCRAATRWRGHALARRGRLRFRDLDGQPLVCPSPGTTARRLIEAAARDCGIVLSVKCDTMQYQTVTSMVAAGLGITVMPLVDPRILDALDLIALPFADLDPFREVGVLSRRQEELSPAARAFLDLLSLVAGDLEELRDTGLRPLSGGCAEIDQLS